MVIVNYRTPALVIESLQSVLPELPSLCGGRVIVVDNASGDGSVARIESEIHARGWDQWAEVVALPRNGGFAYGNNRAIDRVRQRDPEFSFIVFLNPDATVCPGALETLIGHLEAHPDAGIVGASIEDENGITQRSAHLFPSPLGELDEGAELGVLSRVIGSRAKSIATSRSPCVCDWVSGACFAIRRKALEQVGPLDEGFFLYFEETEFCLRAQRLGWSCWFVPAARVVHKEGSATGVRDLTRRRPSYWFASRRRFFAKAHGVGWLLAADLLWAIGYATAVTRRFLGLARSVNHPPRPQRFASDLLIGDLKAVLRGELSNLSLVAEHRS